MADDRKVELDHSPLEALPLPNPTGSAATGRPAAEATGKPSYALWLQLQYQQQLAALQLTMSAAAAHEASHPTQKGPPSHVHSPRTFSGADAGPPPLEVPSHLYSQSASLGTQQASSLSPQWWVPSLNGAEPASIRTLSQTPTQEALGRGPYNMGSQGENRDHYAMLAQQSMMHAAEQDRQQQQVAARLQSIAAGAGFSQAEVGSGLGPPLLRDSAVGFGRAPAQFHGQT